MRFCVYDTAHSLTAAFYKFLVFNFYHSDFLKLKTIMSPIKNLLNSFYYKRLKMEYRIINSYKVYKVCSMFNCKNGNNKRFILNFDRFVFSLYNLNLMQLTHSLAHTNINTYIAIIALKQCNKLNLIEPKRVSIHNMYCSASFFSLLVLWIDAFDIDSRCFLSTFFLQWPSNNERAY